MNFTPMYLVAVAVAVVLLASGAASAQETFVFAMVTDLDVESRTVSATGKHVFSAQLQLATLTAKPNGRYSIRLQENRTLTSWLSRSGRGMELSELVYWPQRTDSDTDTESVQDDGDRRPQLYAVCDYTGAVYHISPLDIDIKSIQRSDSDSDSDVRVRFASAPQALPVITLIGGDGVSGVDKPHKSEWATVDRFGNLVVGSIGKEWVVDSDSGPRIEHMRPQWVKVIHRDGFRGPSHYRREPIAESNGSGSATSETRFTLGHVIEHVDFTPVYDSLRAAVNCSYPGYLIHEAVEFDSQLDRWVFLPRKVSTDTPYTEKDDETKASNLLLLYDDRHWPGKVTDVRRVGSDSNPLYGFTSLRRIPIFGSDKHHYIALRVKEVATNDDSQQSAETHTLITVFDLETGALLLDDDDNDNAKHPPVLEKGYQHVSFSKFEGLAFLPTAAAQDSSGLKK